MDNVLAERLDADLGIMMDSDGDDDEDDSEDQEEEIKAATKTKPKSILKQRGKLRVDGGVDL